MSATIPRLVKREPKPRRSASTPPPAPAEERPPTALWKAVTGDTNRRYRPVPVAPELTAILGYSKAALLTQLDYWMERATYFDPNDDDRPWVYNTLPEWMACTGLSESTVKRGFQDLKLDGYVKIGQFHVSRLTRENFYSLDYKNAARLTERVNKVGDTYDVLCETTKTKRRFFGGAQPLVNGRFQVE